MATSFLLSYTDNETERRRHMRSAQMAPTFNCELPITNHYSENRTF